MTVTVSDCGIIAKEAREDDTDATIAFVCKFALIESMSIVSIISSICIFLAKIVQ